MTFGAPEWQDHGPRTIQRWRLWVAADLGGYSSAIDLDFCPSIGAPSPIGGIKLQSLDQLDHAEKVGLRQLSYVRDGAFESPY